MEKKTILLVDDEPGSIDLYLPILSENYKINQVFNDIEAMNWLSTNTPDCIIVDYMLGEGHITGLELIKKIFEKYPNLPFLMMTGRQDIDLIRNAYKAGVKDFIQKGTSDNEIEE